MLSGPSGCRARPTSAAVADCTEWAHQTPAARSVAWPRSSLARSSGPIIITAANNKEMKRRHPAAFPLARTPPACACDRLSVVPLVPGQHRLVCMRRQCVQATLVWPQATCPTAPRGGGEAQRACRRAVTVARRRAFWAQKVLPLPPAPPLPAPLAPCLSSPSHAPTLPNDVGRRRLRVTQAAKRARLREQTQAQARAVADGKAKEGHTMVMQLLGALGEARGLVAQRDETIEVPLVPLSRSHCCCRCRCPFLLHRQ